MQIYHNFYVKCDNVLSKKRNQKYMLVHEINFDDKINTEK